MRSSYDAHRPSASLPTRQALGSHRASAPERRSATRHEERLAGQGPPLRVPGRLFQVHVSWGDRDLAVRSTELEPVPEGRDAYLSVDPRRCALPEE